MVAERLTGASSERRERRVGRPESAGREKTVRKMHSRERTRSARRMLRESCGGRASLGSLGRRTLFASASLSLALFFGLKIVSIRSSAMARLHVSHGL